ncbi:hypothetical protein MIU24_36185, partial [Streptomyces venezuelae]
MSLVLTNVRAFAIGADLTGSSSKVELSGEVEEKDVTTYASAGWKVLLGGLKSGELGCEFLQDFANTRIDS